MTKKNLTVNTSEAVLITGYESQSLNRLVKEGIIKKDKYGTWDLQKLFNDLTEYKVQLAVKPLQKELESLQQNDPEYRIKKVKADDAEYDFQIKQKKYLPDTDVLDFLNKFGALIVNAFEPQGRMCKKEFKYISDDVKRVLVVERTRDEILDAISNTNISSLLPDSLGNPAGDVIKNRRRVSKKSKTNARSKNKRVGR